MATWNPQDYSRNSSEQQKWARELIAKLGPKETDHILDIGCGDGKVTAELASRVPRGRVVGLDSSHEMVRFASSAFPSGAHPNLSFVHGDASRLNFHEQFDLIFSNATLHWVYDHAPVLLGIWAALKPGGRILVQMGGKGCAADVLKVIDTMRATREWYPYFEGFNFRHGFHGPEEYRSWLRDAGLEAKRVELFPTDMTHRGREGFAGWLRTTWIPFIQAAPEDRRDDFLNEMIERYTAAHPIDADGSVHVLMMRLEVEATRSV